MNPVCPSTRAFTRRQAILLFGAGAAALAGCSGGNSSNTNLRFVGFTLLTTRLAVAQGGYAMLQAQNNGGSFNRFLDYQNDQNQHTLPAGVSDQATSINFFELTRYLEASETAAIGRYGCKYRAISLPEDEINSPFPVEDTSDAGIVDFELLVIPAGAGVGLTVNRDGEATAVNPGGSALFVVGVLATQSLSFGTVDQIGFSGPVTFSVSGLPDGVSAAFSNATVTLSPGGDSAVRLTFTVAAGTAAGTVNFSVTALHGDPAQSVVATSSFRIGGTGTPPPTNGGNLVFSDVTAPIFSEPITGEGIWFRENEGANLFSEVNDRRTVGVLELTERVVRVRVGSPSGSLIGGTYPLIDPPLTAGAQLTILQSGSHVLGAPNYLTYQSTPGIGSIRTEFLPGSTTKIRVTIIESLEMVPDGVAFNSTGSFRLSGTLVMKFSGSSGTMGHLEKHPPLYSQVV